MQGLIEIADRQQRDVGHCDRHDQGKQQQTAHVLQPAEPHQGVDAEQRQRPHEADHHAVEGLRRQQGVENEQRQHPRLPARREQGQHRIATDRPEQDAHAMEHQGVQAVERFPRAVEERIDLREHPGLEQRRQGIETGRQVEVAVVHLIEPVPQLQPAIQQLMGQGERRLERQFDVVAAGETDALMDQQVGIDRRHDRQRHRRKHQDFRHRAPEPQREHLPEPPAESAEHSRAPPLLRAANNDGSHFSLNRINISTPRLLGCRRIAANHQNRRR
jgi:hypothetical protein